MTAPERPSAEDLAAMRAGHFELHGIFGSQQLSICNSCHANWPCRWTRLLNALDAYDALKKERDEYQQKFDRCFHAYEARLAERDALRAALNEARLFALRYGFHRARGLMPSLGAQTWLSPAAMMLGGTWFEHVFELLGEPLPRSEDEARALADATTEQR